MGDELAAENQVYLATGVVLDTYQMFSKTPINSLADLEGKKVAGAGYNLRYLEGIEGATNKDIAGEMIRAIEKNFKL